MEANFAESIRDCLAYGIMSIDRAGLVRMARDMAAKRVQARADDDDDLPSWLKPPMPVVETTAEGVAHITVTGTLSHGLGKFARWWLGCLETDDIAAAVERAADKGTPIVLDVNSPGGYVVGIPELGETIAAAAQRVPVVAHTSTMMASAAYWMAAGATLIYASPSAYVGSIGVFSSIWDYSRLLESLGIRVEVFKSGDLKAAGLTGTSLTDAQRQEEQAHVDRLGELFRGFVRAHRGADDAAMRGQAVMASEDVANGWNLVDAVTNLAAAIRDAASLKTNQ